MKSITCILLSLVAATGIRALSPLDASFLENAVRSGLAEVAISAAVADNLTKLEVKNFALMMIADHGKANAELSALADRKGVVIREKSRYVKELTQRWSQRLADQDTAYLEKMETDHKESITLFEIATKGQDPEIAAIAEKNLPLLRHHLATLQSLRRNEKE
ncbi:MAG TPA: DUF4142 domain-containing protein [Opitutaceae bacterium]|nr:DUF4142 domain-containing protein [Opitutaceae bacterium]